MPTTAAARTTSPGVSRNRSRAAANRPPQAPVLSAAERRELVAELRRELAMIERRLGAPNASTLPLHATWDARRDAIRKALGRVADGQYGTCQRCAEPIPYGRLVVLPEATDCVRCHGA